MSVLKSIVLALALANVGYFLWVHGVARSTPLPAAAPLTTLRLAAEAAVVRAAAPAEQGIVAAAEQASTPLQCVSVGPFRDVSDAAHAASTLRSGGYDPRQRVVDGEVWAGVWVYVPLPANHGATEQILIKLKTAGIDDALEMPGPNEGAVISLGLFSEPKRAQARVAQAQALGLSAVIVDRKRAGNVYWLEVELKATDAALNLADLQGEAGRIQRLELKPCLLAAASHT